MKMVPIVNNLIIDRCNEDGNQKVSITSSVGRQSITNYSNRKFTMSTQNGHTATLSSTASDFTLMDSIQIEAPKTENHTDLTTDLTTNKSAKKKTPATGEKKKANNKAVGFHLDLDAGSHNVKARLNGEYKVFQSVAKLIDGDVPLRDNGCFAYGKKCYVVGKAVERVNGKSIVNANDNKLSQLAIWIIGAITHYRKQMKALVEGRRRKTEPAQINLTLRIMTLSSIKRKELDAAIKQISAFQWDDFDILVNVKAVEFVNEAYGAALEIAHTHDLEEFRLLDLGGGTLTYSHGYWNGDEVSTSQQPISGAGMVGIINLISTALTRTDRGATGTATIDIQLALESSKTADSVVLRSSGKNISITDEVNAALDDWVRGNHTVKALFDRISQDLVRGNAVFCTGGGFAIPAIAQWIIAYLTDGIDDANIQVLPNPEKINMTGLSNLDAGKAND